MKLSGIQNDAKLIVYIQFQPLMISSLSFKGASILLVFARLVLYVLWLLRTNPGWMLFLTISTHSCHIGFFYFLPIFILYTHQNSYDWNKSCENASNYGRTLRMKSAKKQFFLLLYRFLVCVCYFLICYDYLYVYIYTCAIAGFLWLFFSFRVVISM